jgi:methylated-DNA-[protein]-cysteine S-methyltransferase
MVAPVFSTAGSLFQAILETPFGVLGIRTGEGLVKEISYLPDSVEVLAPNDKLSKEAVRQVRAYLHDPSFVFDLPLHPVGSAFQQRVWQAIRAIPCGEVRSYGAVARAISSAPRAVGQACGANWFPLVIPCHRVIASAGLGGFGGSGEPDGRHLRIKRWLLRHEGAKDERLNG